MFSGETTTLVPTRRGTQPETLDRRADTFGDTKVFPNPNVGSDTTKVFQEELDSGEMNRLEEATPEVAS